MDGRKPGITQRAIPECLSSSNTPLVVEEREKFPLVVEEREKFLRDHQIRSIVTTW